MWGLLLPVIGQIFKNLLLIREPNSLSAYQNKMILRSWTANNLKLCSRNKVAINLYDCAAPDTKKLQKTYSLDVAKRYVETHSSSNAATPDPAEKGAALRYYLKKKIMC